MNNLSHIPQDIQKLIDDACNDLGFDVEDKKLLAGTLYIGIYKAMLEMLFGFLGNNREFATDLGVFFNKSIEKLSPTEKQAFEQVITEEKFSLFETTLTNVANNLPKEEGDTLKANIQKAISQEKSA